MPRSALLSYADAVRLLSTADKSAAMLDRVRDVVTGVLVDPHLWIARRGYDGLQRMHAAHAVIVLVAFFQAFDALGLRITCRSLRLSRPEQLMLGGLETLFDETLPLPSADRPFERTLADLKDVYRTMATGLFDLISGCAVWDTLDETSRARVHLRMTTELGGHARRRYEELLRQLAADVPEVSLWLTLQDGQATRSSLSSLRVGDHVRRDASAVHGVFISYRRVDSRHIAGRIADRVMDRLGAEQVFIDVESIGPGVDFAEAVAVALDRCQVVLVVIGRDWAAVTDEAGRPRLAAEEDLVRIEVETAFQRKIKVIPVLVDAAEMPRAAQLPECLRKLAECNAVSIRHESFHRDVRRLLGALQPLV